MDVLNSALAGIGSGGLFAAVGVLLTLTAMLTQVINFAQIAVGVFAAYTTIHLFPSRATPAWLLLIVAVVIAAVLSSLLGWVISRWLGSAGTTARSAVTVAALLGLLALSNIIFGTRPANLVPLLIGPAFSIGGAVVPKISLLLLGIAIAVAIAAHVVLRWTPIGIRLRAIADRQATAEMLGVNVRVLQIGIWAVMGVVIGVIVMSAGNAQFSGAGSMITYLIPATAAALVGAFKRPFVTILGGLLVGALQGLVTAFPQVLVLKDWIPLVIILLVLLWNQRKEVWDAAR